jgi:hypothetical protein
VYFSEQEMFCKYDPKEIPDGIISNLMELRARLNQLGFRPPRIFTCTYRSPEHNARVGGAKKSSHLTGCACDIADADGLLKDYLRTNPELLEECDLYAEDFDSTPTWVHLTTLAPKSGRRIFKP